MSIADSKGKYYVEPYTYIYFAHVYRLSHQENAIFKNIYMYSILSYAKIALF